MPVYLHPEDAGGTDRLMPTAALGPLTLWREGEVLEVTLDLDQALEN